MHMKKIVLFTLLALPAIFGCSKSGEQQKDSYMVQINPVKNEIISRDGYDIKNNEAYLLVTKGVDEISTKYGKSILATDSKEVLESYDKALTELKALKGKFDEVIASGKDFGASQFDLSLQCRALKGVSPIKSSEAFDFVYTSNTRIPAAKGITIKMLGAEVSGSEPILVYDGEADLKIQGYKLYEPDGTLSASKIIRKVDVLSSPESTSFEIFYKATKGVDSGKFYLLIEFNDGSDTFDYKVDIEIKEY